MLYVLIALLSAWGAIALDAYLLEAAYSDSKPRLIDALKTPLETVRNAWYVWGWAPKDIKPEIAWEDEVA
jgi:hypothetical protein